MIATWTETRAWTDPATDEEHEVEVDFAWVDHGIGPYEFWGSRGNDVQMAAEVLEVRLGGRPIEVEDSFMRRWQESATAPEDPDV